MDQTPPRKLQKQKSRYTNISRSKRSAPTTPKEGSTSTASSPTQPQRDTKPGGSSTPVESSVPSPRLTQSQEVNQIQVNPTELESSLKALSVTPLKSELKSKGAPSVVVNEPSEKDEESKVEASLNTVRLFEIEKNDRRKRGIAFDIDNIPAHHFKRGVCIASQTKVSGPVTHVAFGTSEAIPVAIGAKGEMQIGDRVLEIQIDDFKLIGRRFTLILWVFDEIANMKEIEIIKSLG